MGTWGVRAFENDTACDWAYGLEGTEDLTHVEAALDQVLVAGEEYLDADVACDALAACEVLARLQGRPGYTSAHTEAVDQWVAARKGRLVPTGEVLARAEGAIDRILGEDSELSELWEESDGEEWRAAVEDLRRRLRT
jgi:hypothetical protein